ncbi:hypothetical protein ANN_19242 [Periplaneta americana]|uniref:Uncharacterized protein n=1 Tax=Periplaneta americana TaxID=6978 RepID=A0ABQ8S9M7_PERAM|nr:hypothetical protein ANN_19242 [Periplaneta americana]
MSMGMHVMSKSHLQDRAEDDKILRHNVLDMAHNAVRKAYTGLNQDQAPENVVDITVSYDGSLHKRGHMSHYGVGIVIDVLTGLVIDFEYVPHIVPHAVTRLVTGLNNTVSVWRAKGVTIGSTKTGRLTKETILKLQLYYRQAIKNNIPNVQHMKTAIYTTVYHAMSTAENLNTSSVPASIVMVLLQSCYSQSVFNVGCEVSEKLKESATGLNMSESGVKVTVQRDKRRINQSEVTHNTGHHSVRKRLKFSEMASQHQEKRAEGTTYVAGQF